MPLPNAQADRTSALRQLTDTLFDFEALPGRFPLTLREPRILFDGSHDVLLLAAGRPVEGLAPGFTDMPRLKRAACFFVRTVMLRPGSDHYTVLGLEQGFSKNSLRLHYRILIRLTHPDFVGNTEAWPTGSATRINLAHDVLSSAVRQAEYNRTLPGIERRRTLPVQSLAAVLPRPVANSNKLFKYRVWAFLSAGIFASLLLAVLWPGDADDGHERRAAQIERPDFPGTAASEPRSTARPPLERQAPSIPTAPVPSSGLANKGSKDLTATVARDDGASASRQALQASQVLAAKASKEAKEAEFVKSAQAEKLAQLAQRAQEAEAARLAKSVKATQDAMTTEAAQAAALKQAQLAHEAMLMRAKLAAVASQTASETRAATLLVQAAKAAREVQASRLANEEKAAKLAQAALPPQPSRTAQVSPEAKPVRPVKPSQLARPVQEAQLALAVQLPKTPEVSATEAVSMNVSAASVKPLPAQPVNDAAVKLSLVDAQPALNQLIQSMQAGRGEDLLRGLERSVSRSGGATDLVNAYNVLIGGSRAVRVGRVQLRGRPVADQLNVDGVVQLILQDQGQPLPVRELQLRAAFVLRDGQVVMTELSTSGSRP